MRERVNLRGGLRGHWRARGRVAIAVVLGTTAVAMLGPLQPVTAQQAAPPPSANQAPPSCQPLFMNSALERQFSDIAPGVPYQAGGDPVQKQGRPEGKAAILTMVLDQMGFIRGFPQPGVTAFGGRNVHTINRLRFCGSGQMVEDGHTYQVTTYVYAISLHERAAREDIQAEGPAGKVRLIRVVLDHEAWDESTPGVGTHSADRLAEQRQLQLMRTPFGIADALTTLDDAKVQVQDPGAGHGAVTLRLPLDGVPTEVVLDESYRPATVTHRVDHHLIVDHYSDYHDLNQYGVMVPRRIVETIDGHPHLDLHVIEGQLATYEEFPTPAFEAPREPAANTNFEFGRGG